MSLTLPSLAPPAPPVLADQLLALRRRWRIILAATIIVPLLALAAMLASPTTYTATGILLYDPAGAAIPGDSDNLPQDAANEDAVTASQGAIIASLPAAAQIARQLNLASLAEFNPALRRRSFFGFLRHDSPAGAAAVAQAVQRALSVAVMPGSRILTVGFTSHSPQLAASAANLAMTLYLNHERDQSFAALTDAQDWLETHSATVQTGLDQTETQLAQARAAAGVVQGAQASLTTETVSRLAAALVQAQAVMAMNQARLQSAAAGGDAAAANAAIAPNLLPLRQRQADLAAQVQSLAAQYGPNYPARQEAQSQLAAITGEIGAEAGRELDAAKADLAADAAQIHTLQAALNNAQAQEQAQDQESAPIRALEQRAMAGQDMLRAMTSQAGQLAQDASLTKPDARILSTAAVPSEPSTPHRGLILAAALGLGFCAGILLAGLRDALDTSLHSGTEIRAVTGLACYALVPENPRPYVAALELPFSLYAEQLRALRTGLGLVGGPCKIIAITAARPGEGKTTLTIALARSLASAGLRVLAVDGDIRQPSFDPLFRTGGAKGLTDHLAGLATRDEILIEDRLSGAWIMPAGTQAKSALSLFLSPSLPQFLYMLRESYDVILIDAPPAFALAEGRVLARLADSALLCIRWGQTPRRVVRAAILLLEEAGVVLAGTALTRVNTAAHEKSGYADAEMYHPRYGGYFRQ
ncbi:polysaccharide biosynthesis tyrosine autokinase [Acidocella sp.]|uniref:GumC family protein n=1 Tax=Acidocella sp. TaxID=50710 RepID=UPI0026085F1D|nr:polysaccharide biosynthesis tyrosine autokinase [Acidocella sp.]